MNKLLTIFILTLSLSAFANKRKISNTYYYYCTFERSSEVKDNYKDEFVFHLSKNQQKTTITKSKRWNKTEITLTSDYKIDISIEERVQGVENKLSETINPQGLSYSNPVIIDKEFQFKIKEKEVNFRLHCE